MAGDSFCVPKSRLLRYERGTDEPWPTGLVGMVDCLLESAFDGDFELLTVVFIFTVAPTFSLHQ